MGKTAVLTVFEKMITDTPHQERKTQKVMAKEEGCSQSAVSKHIGGKLEVHWWRENCGRERCTSTVDNKTLKGL